MADGMSRNEAKNEARQQGVSVFAFSDGKIRAFETRKNYQKIVMRFLNWCRETQHIQKPDDIDVLSDELVSLYLLRKMEQGYSAWTLKTERSALRLYFGDRSLAEEVDLPKRRRQDITRSRLPTVRDTHINLANWQHVIQFCLACGTRREELRDLLVRDVWRRVSDQQLFVHVNHGKGGKQRDIPVFPGREPAVEDAVAGKAPEARIFVRISGLLDIHSYRRQFAQELYEYRAGRPLPPAEGRLSSADLDREAAKYVSKCLGHNRIDVIFGYYLR
jgi:integrase